jgi:hypothetical protein
VWGWHPTQLRVFFAKMREGSRRICSGGVKKAAKVCNGRARVGDDNAHKNTKEGHQEIREQT